MEILESQGRHNPCPPDYLKFRGFLGDVIDVNERASFLADFRDHTFMLSTRKRGGVVLKFVKCLRILLFCGRRGWRGQKLCHFLWTS